MSHAHYNDLWHKTQRELQKTLNWDINLQRKDANPDLEQAKWIISHLFMKYVLVVNKLDECYDQICHPQKREVIGRLLDCALGRLLEIKRDIVKLECDDYSFFDNILMELKLTHQDIEVHVPKYYWIDREKELERRRELIKQAIKIMKRNEEKEEILRDIPEEEQDEYWEEYLEEQEAEELAKQRLEEILNKRPGYVPPPAEEEPPPGEMTLRDAVLVIQRHERARQGRALGVTGKINRVWKLSGLKPKQIPEEYSELGATIIQRHWRRHRQRILAKRRDVKALLLLGMVHPSWRDPATFRMVEEGLKKRRILQERNQIEYEEALVTVKERMAKVYTPSLIEDIGDEIRYWFEYFFKQTEDLPKYPPEDLVIPTGEIFGIPKGIPKDFFGPVTKAAIPGSQIGMALCGIQAIGGSALVVGGHWITPKDYLQCKAQLDKLKKDKQKGGKKEKPPKPSKEELKEKKAKEKAAEAKRLAAEEAKGYRIKDSNFTAPLIKANKDYKVTWIDIDESNNYEQRFIYEFVKNDKCYEVSMEVRVLVDQMMELELELLEDALYRDRHPKKKRKKKKKKKKPKKKKGKKKKDPTADRTMDDLFTELYINGIIKDYEPARLVDFMGEHSYNAFELRADAQDPVPAPGDVRELILQYCILPLGSMRVHQLSPVFRSICLLGPECGGKEFLARIICTETASLMFDLTPATVAGKYPGAKGLKMLQHLVEKVSRALQPSIIFIDGAEKPFYKKVPKPERQTEPKRLKKFFTKIAKGIKPEDQVLVLGISSFPWLCKQKKLIKTYDKIIYIPKPDYGTLYKLWEDLLTKYHNVNREFDFSALAKVSKGYSVKTIMDLVKQVLNAERIGRLGVKPFKEHELMEELCKLEPSSEKDEEKCLKLLMKTDIGKKKKVKLEERKALKEKAGKK